MLWHRALEIMDLWTRLGEKDYTDDEKEEAFDTVSTAVLRIVGSVDDEVFSDWLCEGDYDGTETAESIADAWRDFLSD